MTRACQPCQADRAPRARASRRARDATAGLTVTHLANGSGVVSMADTDYQCGRRRTVSPSTCPSFRGPCQLTKGGKVIRLHSTRHDRVRVLGAFANPEGRPRRKHSAIGNFGLGLCLGGPVGLRLPPAGRH